MVVTGMATMADLVRRSMPEERFRATLSAASPSGCRLPLVDHR
jgi:hypothetical protein